MKAEVDKFPATTDRNLMAALSYVWIISLIMLVTKRGDAFVQFHAKQALVLFVISLFGVIPIIGWILWPLTLLGMVIGFIHAWQGKEYQIPFVYGWSKKVNF